MRLRRILLSSLLAVAIILAPIANAWAALSIAASGVPVAVATAVPAPFDEGADGLSAPAKEICATMKSGVGFANDCPCGAGDDACRTEVCMAKCSQFHGLLLQTRALVRVVMSRLVPDALARAADWSSRPQPPPPRA